MSTDVNRMQIADKWREKLKASNMLELLIQFVEGKIEMQPHRAQAILKLVGKFLPDLQATTLDITVNHKTMNRLELEARAHILGINPNDLWNSIDTMNVIEHEKVQLIQEDSGDGLPPDVGDSAAIS